MASLVCLSLLLMQLSPTTEAAKDSCVFKWPTVIWRKPGEDVTLPCNFGSDCLTSDLRYQWFVFKEASHAPLNASRRFTFAGSSLTIRAVGANDSGIYHCSVVRYAAPSPRAQQVDTGTTLVVTAKVRKIVVRHKLLWVSLALMAVYSLTVVTLVVLKKRGCNFTKSKETNQKNSARKATFRDVLQEMYGRKKEGRNRNQRRPEVQTSQFDAVDDDTYQNL